MARWRIRTLCTTIAAGSVLAAAGACARAASNQLAPGRAGSVVEVPAVALSYGGGFDRYCAQIGGIPLDTVMASSVRSRLPTYTAQWTARGPALLAAARELVGPPYRFREARATLFTCRGMSSMGTPLILNARAFWRASPDSAATEHTRFVGLLFHELLHGYIGPILNVPGGFTRRPTPLLTKYAADSVQAGGYLHLFALMQLTYERLGLAHEWEVLKAMHRGWRHPPADRAHEILAAEGAEAFLQEMRTAAATDRPR